MPSKRPLDATMIPSVVRASATMRRASLRQPVHRRPFYGKTERSFETYANRRSSFRGSGVDHGMDNFSYDPDHLKRYEMDPDLTQSLPEEVSTQAQLWQCAAAAVDTSLDRTNKLYEEARNYAYPTQQSHPSRLRSVSDLLPRISSTDTPPYISSPAMSADKNSAPVVRASLLQPTPEWPSTPVESPPMTPPYLSFSSGSSVQGDNAFPALEPVDTLKSSSWTEQSGAEPAEVRAFDPISWETYTLKYQQQLNDVQEAFRRMMGYGRKIDILCKEMVHDSDKSVRTILIEFIKWWAPMERIFVPELQSKIDHLDTPDLAYIRIEHELTSLSLSQMAGALGPGTETSEN